MKNNSPKEDEEQMVLVEYLDLMLTNGRILGFTAIRHGAYAASWSVRMRSKRLGLRPGFPDIIVATRQGLAFIELKRQKGGSLAPEQREWARVLNLYPSVEAVVCRGAAEAINYLDALLQIKPLYPDA